MSPGSVCAISTGSDETTQTDKINFSNKTYTLILFLHGLVYNVININRTVELASIVHLDIHDHETNI